MDKLIFNASMPRSGSELLQVILHQNPKIYGSATSPLCDHLLSTRSGFEGPATQSQNQDIMRKAYFSMCEAMSKYFYKGVTDRPIVVDKGRSWLGYTEFIEQWNPNPKVIMMVRDLRSIISSFEKRFRDNRHRIQGPDMPMELKNLTTDERANYWLTNTPVGTQLKFLRDVYEKNIHEKILFVRYEDLCSDPNQQLRRIYEYLEEPFFKHNLDKIVKEVEEDDRFWGMYGNHTVKEKLEKPNLYGWKDILPQATADGIRKEFDWYFETFEY